MAPVAELTAKARVLDAQHEEQRERELDLAAERRLRECAARPMRWRQPEAESALMR